MLKSNHHDDINSLDPIKGGISPTFRISKQSTRIPPKKWGKTVSFYSAPLQSQYYFDAIGNSGKQVKVSPASCIS